MRDDKEFFVRKSYTTPLYKWRPSEFEKKINPLVGSNKQNKRPFFCNALPNSQGEDWVVTYTYDINVTPEAVQQHLAYVECDYVV
jgi:hypothetical protein